MNRSSHVLSRTSQAFRALAATDPALAWAVDATSNPYSVYTHAAGLLGAALAAVFAIGLASAAVGYILWDYKERKSDDPNRPYDLRVDMEKGVRSGRTGPSPSPAPQYPPANPTGGNGPSDMELLMAEFVRLDVDSDEVLDALQGVLDNDQEGESGMRVIYDMLVSGMQRRVMTAATAAIAITLGVQQRLPFTMATEILERSLRAPKKQKWQGLLTSTLVDANMMSWFSLYGLTHVRRATDLVALSSGKLTTAQAFDVTWRLAKGMDWES